MNSVVTDGFITRIGDRTARLTYHEHLRGLRTQENAELLRQAGILTNADAGRIRMLVKPADELSGQPRIGHRDLTGANVHAWEDGTLTAVVDWDGCAAVPWQQDVATVCRLIMAGVFRNSFEEQQAKIERFGLGYGVDLARHQKYIRAFLLAEIVQYLKEVYIDSGVPYWASEHHAIQDGSYPVHEYRTSPDYGFSRLAHEALLRSNLKARVAT